MDSPLILVCGLLSRVAIQQSFQAGFSNQGEAMQTLIGGLARSMRQLRPAMLMEPPSVL